MLQSSAQHAKIENIKLEKNLIQFPDKEMSALITTEISEAPVVFPIIATVAVVLFMICGSAFCILKNKFTVVFGYLMWVSALVIVVAVIIAGPQYSSPSEMLDELGILSTSTSKVVIPKEDAPTALLDVEVRQGNMIVTYDSVILTRKGNTVTMTPSSEQRCSEWRCNGVLSKGDI